LKIIIGENLQEVN